MGEKTLKDVSVTALLSLLAGCASNHVALEGGRHKSNNYDARRSSSRRILKMDSKITEGELLFDYYQSSVAVVGEASYTEITIEKAVDGILYLNVYSGSHSHSAYTVPPCGIGESARCGG